MNYAVIMAGGSGQRLWPLSRRHRPKQIIDAFDGQSLLQHCYDRIKDMFPPENILVVTNQEYADIIARHMTQIPRENILGEPVGRDTANAIGLAAVVLEQLDPEATMSVFSADQIIEPVETLHAAINDALQFVQDQSKAIVTLGIKATTAHTGYGYLKRGACLTNHPVCKVEEFREKPNKSTARGYLRSGDYCWNSGIFFWKAKTILGLLDRFLPASCERLRFIGDHWDTPERYAILTEQFPKLQKISIDYAILEHAEEVYMVEMAAHWQDVGSYEALVEHFGVHDTDSNVWSDKTLCHWLQSQNCIAISTDPSHLIAGVSTENLIIVHTSDATLVCQRDDSGLLKKMLEQLESKKLDSSFDPDLRLVMQYLAIDHGLKRVGLALCDSGETIVSPLCQLDNIPGKPHVVLAKIVKIVQDYRIGALVVGLPLNMDGSEGDQARLTRQFALELSWAVPLAVFMQDERLSSAYAGEVLSTAGLTDKKRKARRDMLAACAILKGFLKQ